MINIEIFSEGIRFPYKKIGRKKIRDIARKAAGLLMLENSRVTLIITDNAYIRTINKKFRGKDVPTDVLSFSYNDDQFPRVDATRENIGDIYISAEQATQQAEEYRTALIYEIRRLIVHGLLHLAGYDHEKSSEDEAVMMQKEEELCGRIMI